MRRISRAIALALIGMASVASIVRGGPQTVVESNSPLRERDVVFVATSDAVASAMLSLVNVTKSDVVYDLGCGDGAILIAAAKLGARVVGVDIDPQRIREATENVRKAGVQDRVTLIRGDIFDPNLKIGEASVVALYLLPELNRKLMPRLKTELKPGSRVVSHTFHMGRAWPSEKTIIVEKETIHSWTIQ